ncbi:hypothetical protein MUY35_01255 [Aliiroseovarius sp. S1339]|uniref:DUF6603 domain-containing protein n=1 Tax=Aliiroseovarius sp. S1339 TaxID=2936990 RepID=UPI0020C0552E|nr:DUF6603 domain-containing protein [Aliiroseovarius sp. S1339]MCK8462474.1 hypothetical protein [Aliiroseovarius sp. S1339]
MNAFSPDSFGDTSDLLRALGLVDGDGEFNEDWLRNPEDYLRDILADDAQRSALLAFAQSARGGEEERDAEARYWIELFADNVSTGARIRFYLVLDDDPVPSTEVHLFLGVKFDTRAPLTESQSSLMIPLFRAGKEGTPRPSPDLIGQRGGFFAISSEITIANTPTPPGEAGLRAVGLRLLVPTIAADGLPVVALTLGGLQLPGEATGRDLNLSLTDPDALGDAGIELIVGLMQAQLGASADPQVAALAELLGLGTNPVIPNLPVTDIFDTGPDVLVDWLAQTLGETAARTAWLQSLAALLANGAAVEGADTVRLPVGSANLRVGFRVGPGAAGRPVITMSTRFGMTSGNAEAEFVADIVKLDLGTGEAMAVPSLRAQLRYDLSTLAAPNVSADALVLGFGLNEGRRPLLIIEVLNATVFGTNHPRLDLTNPEALAATAAAAVTDALAEVLGNLGPAGDLIAVVLGWRAPTGAPAGFPVIDLIAFFGDPLGQLRDHWKDVLANHAPDVSRVLGNLRRLITGDTTADAITGSGTIADPWELALDGGVYVAIWQNGGGRLVLGLGVRQSVDTIANGETVIETRARVALLSVDLDSGATGFLPEITVQARAAMKDGSRLSLGRRSARVAVDHLSLALLWRAQDGFDFAPETPNPELFLDGVDVPIPLPEIRARYDDLVASFDDKDWDAIERLVVALTDRVTSADWLRDLIDAVGWQRSAPILGKPDIYRLRLADLVDDAEAALRAWVAEMLSDAQIDIARRLQPLARFLSGDSDADVHIDGSGTLADPWRIDLLPGAGLPAIAVWRQPDTPLPIPDVTRSIPIRRWLPGDVGLEPGILADAILSEYPAALGPFGTELARDSLGDGLAGVAALWEESDGRVRVPEVDVPGTTLHLVENQTATALLAGIDLTEILDSAPTVSVTVRVLPADADLPSGVDAARVLDMREAGRDPLAFTPLPATNGDWHILLAPRSDAALAVGDASGILGQVARLRHALSLIRSLPGVVLVAAPEAGHAAWLALVEMGSGIDRFVAIGLPLTLADAPTALPFETEEALRRLSEFMPAPDTDEPDDDDLARARALLEQHLDTGLDIVRELTPPPGWSTTLRPGLDAHLVYGVIETDAALRAMTAAAAAGLSLAAQARNIQRELQKIESASLGALLPLNTATGGSGIAFTGHLLAEIVGVDIDVDAPSVSPRTAHAVVLAAGLRREGGWLVGGPGTDDLLELRALEVEAQLTVGASSEPARNRVAVTLHGVRINDQRFARVTLTPEDVDAAIGPDRFDMPTSPEMGILLRAVFDEAATSVDPVLQRFMQALRALQIVDGDGHFDALSLSNWIDDPAARLQQVLSDTAQYALLVGLIENLSGDHAGLTFDPISSALSISCGANTGLPLFTEWSIDATIAGGGVTAAGLRLGALTGTRLVVDFLPFAANLQIAPDDGARMGRLPTTLPLWPTIDFEHLAKTALPALAAVAAEELLEGVRDIHPQAKTITDAFLNALGMLQDGRTSIPPLLFIDPASALRQSDILGNGAVFQPVRVAALIDALKPITGLAGPSGVLTLATGVSLRARDVGGLVLDIAFDPAAFMPGADIDFGGAVGLEFTADGRVLPAISSFAGLAGGVPGNSAAHLTVANGATRLFVRNAAGSDLEIFPNPADLGAITTAAVTAALPLVLDAIADSGTDHGDLIADIGDALLLRQSGSFHGPTLAAWATDPAGSLQTRWPALLASGLSNLDDALPADISASSDASGVTVTIAQAGSPSWNMTLTFNQAPLFVELGGVFAGLPFIESVATTLRFDATGLARLNATLGPAEIPVDPALTLRPVFSLDVGSSVPSPFVSVGLSVDAAHSQALAMRYSFNTQSFDLGFGSNSPEEIATGILHFAIDMLGGFVVQLPEVDAVLNETVGSRDIRFLLSDVVLNDTGTALDAELFRVMRNPGESEQQLIDSKIARVIKLLQNIASANPSVTIDGVLTIGLSTIDGVLGINLALADRLAIAQGDIAVWLENDNRWIIGTPDAGVIVGLVDISNPINIRFAPRLSVNGVGLRIGRSNAPLLTEPIGLGSVAFHIYAALQPGQVLGGAQVELAEISVAVGGGSGESSDGNGVAEGMLSETNDGEAPLAPAFSPALSVQTKPGGGIAVGFRAGEGDGPWWLPIRSQFGPIYIDQIGLGAQMDAATQNLKSVSLLFDGNVSIAGLQAAVDDLELRHRLDRGGIFDPEAWAVDLAGLAISADMSGVTLAGGLRKFGDPPSVDYIGMLQARFASYGLSVYGGYSSVNEDNDQYSAFFVYGAVLGPFGGPPCFFLTGVGGGFGINRDIKPPDDIGKFNEFTMIAALDPAYRPSDDLMAEMEKVRNEFLPKKGNFWFAAGISFNSFALVDGIAVVAVEFGHGFELSIFGLARMALPRPEAALVSIELGLIARFSTEEGVIWIQAQLTENSWLFHQSARLTGGFAYVSWFKGAKAGEFVITLGGYHPNFHRDGYPVVPRLGFNWSVSSNIVVKAETYFALTSEAFMAGGLFEASAKFGPAYAHLSFGGNAIVYFDPFRYEADAHVRVSAGIRINVLFGTINLSFSLGAFVEVAGPEFHGSARVEIGPIDITVRFGNANGQTPDPLSWVAFVEKYLELAPGNRAAALSSIAGRGALPPPVQSSSGSERGATPDGSAAHPFEVMSEFELSLTSTIPILSIALEGKEFDAQNNVMPNANLGLAPMRRALGTSRLNLRLVPKHGSPGGPIALQDTARVTITPRTTGRFPKGVWGIAPGEDEKVIPKGDVIPATEGVDLKFVPSLNARIPIASTGGVSFDQVEPSRPAPLPLRRGGAIRARVIAAAQQQRALLKTIDHNQMPIYAGEWHRATRNTDLSLTPRSATAMRSFQGNRATPMRVGLLSERIVGSVRTGRKKLKRRPTDSAIPQKYRRPQLRGMLQQELRSTDGVFAEKGTQVTARTRAAKGLKRMAPPLLDAMQAERSVLLRTEVRAPTKAGTLLAEGHTPETARAASAVSFAAKGSGPAERAVLGDVQNNLVGTRTKGSRDTVLSGGQIAVFDLPASTAVTRFPSNGALALSGAGRLLVIGGDGELSQNRKVGGQVELSATDRAFAIIAGVEASSEEIAGWVESTDVAYLGYSLARCRGGVVRAEGAGRARGGRKAGTGWMTARDLVDQSSLVETDFDAGATCVAVVLEGPGTEADLADLSIAISGAKLVDQRPQIVPFDGKTLLVYDITSDDKGASLRVSVAGRIAERLDGVLATSLGSDALISRVLNSAMNLDLEVISDSKASGATARWIPPKDVELE